MRKKIVCLVLFGAAFALSASASHAAIISFENPAGPGHFDWNGSSGHQHLELTMDAFNQPGVSTSTSGFFRQNSASGPAVRGAVSTSTVHNISLQPAGCTQAANFLVPLNVGESIPTANTFGVGLVFRTVATGTCTQTNLPDGVPTYLGVRFDIDGAGPGSFNYGWIGIVRTGLEVDAFGWAYETEVGVPIAVGAVPEPASFSLLLISGIAAIRGRRKRT